MKEKTTVIKELTKDFDGYNICIKTLNEVMVDAIVKEEKQRLTIFSLRHMPIVLNNNQVESHLEKINKLIIKVKSLINALFFFSYCLETYRENLKKEIKNEN